MPFPMPRDPSFMLEYCREWVNDANYRYDHGMRAMAQESIRTAAQLYVQLPQGYSDLEFERYYEETLKKVYG